MFAKITIKLTCEKQVQKKTKNKSPKVIKTKNRKIMLL